MSFVSRRVRNFVLLAAATVLAYICLTIIDRALLVQQYYSGWLLVSVMLTFMLFYLKKRLPTLPIGLNSIWAQWHYYLGLFFILVFAFHVEFELPNGKFEIVMSILLLIVSGSGIAGTMINRSFAKRLSYLPEEILYERIPHYRHLLQEQAENLIEDVVEKTNSTTLRKYYQTQLHGYFVNYVLLPHIIGSQYPFLKARNKLDQQMRYLNEDEAATALELQALLEKKYTLDRSYALQWVLKHWGILHMPVGLMLLCCIVLHILLVYAFRGAA